MSSGAQKAPMYKAAPDTRAGSETAGPAPRESSRPVSLGGTGKPLLLSRPTEESSTSMTTIWMLTRLKRRSRGKS